MAGSPADVLIAGGGIAALETALALRELAGERARVRILAPTNTFTYLPAATAEPFAPIPWAQAPLSALAAGAGATLVKGSLGVVEVDERTAMTADARRLAYDLLVVAVGASRIAWLRGADLTFRGPQDVAAYRRLVEVVAGEARRGASPHLAIVVPSGPGWSLPAYELALLTGRHLRGEGAGRARITVLTAENEPLSVFGPTPAAAIAAELADAGIALMPSAAPRSFVGGRLRLTDGDEVEVDHLVVLPHLRGPSLPGLPSTPLGFLPVDAHGRVRGADGVYAAGDATDVPLKQGGIACQMADAVAAHIAASLGADVDAEPFAPTLRGLVWSGGEARFMRADAAGGRDESAGVITAGEPLWWPPGKVAGRHLAPFLDRAGPGTATLVDLPPLDPDERADASSRAGA